MIFLQEQGQYVRYALNFIKYRYNMGTHVYKNQVRIYGMLSIIFEKGGGGKTYTNFYK